MPPMILDPVMYRLGGSRCDIGEGLHLTRIARKWSMAGALLLSSL